MQYQFKTNINCGGCIAKVQPVLDQAQQIQSWSVDTNDPQKILTVETEALSPVEVVDLLKSAGFTAEPKKKRRWPW